MKMVDNMPIIIVIAAIFINIAIGVRSNIGFSALMIRCIVVTIVFGILGYMVTDTIKSAIECSSLSKLPHGKDVEAEGLEENLNNKESKSFLDIKVPPLDDKEFMRMDNSNDDEFVEVNPVYMGNYKEDEQD